MKKINKMLFLFVVALLVFPNIVDASYYCDIKVVKEGVRVRKDYNKTDSYAILTNGGTFDMPDAGLVGVNKVDACKEGWYKVYYNGNVGYVCSRYVTVHERKETPVVDNTEARTACEADLKAKGFPSSYWNGLCNLKVKYPNWTFEAVNTGLNFADAVAGEAKCKKNTIISSSSDEYKDTTCSGSLDSGYSHASAAAVAYYMNPLNFFTETSIFMFESSYINPNVSNNDYKTITPNILGSFMTEKLPTLTNAMYTAGTTKNVSPIILSARIKQEIGSGKATTNKYAGDLLSCICGKYTTRWGTTYEGKSLDNYYNFFNIGVNDGSNGDAAYKAVVTAYKRGWGGTGNQEVDLGKAIGGGADFLNNNYITKGQNTIYFQKFNTHPSNTGSLYSNQYMTNVKAPESEAKIVYSAYKNAGKLSSGLKFFIPIYSNLSGGIINNGDGATGDNTNNTNGGMDVNTIVVSTGYKINNNKLTGVQPCTSMNDIKNKIIALGGSVSSNNSGTAGTGTKITVSNGKTSVEYTIIVRGDTSGDGVINALDLLQVQKNILRLYSFNDASQQAADADGDGAINARDLLAIQKNILGKYTISQ